MIRQLAAYILYCIAAWCAIGAAVVIWKLRNVEGDGEPWYWRLVEWAAVVCLMAPGWPLLVWDDLKRGGD